MPTVFLHNLITRLTRAPFAATAPAAAVAPGMPPSSFCLGDEDSALALTELELLREAVAACPDTVCAFIIGLPTAAVERVLAAAGFDLTGHFHALGETRRHHRFLDESGGAWHLTEGEPERLDIAPAWKPGEAYALSDELRFADRKWLGGDRFRHFETGTVSDLPRRLVYQGLVGTKTPPGFDALVCSANVEEALDRLRNMERPGLNAERYLRTLLECLFRFNEPPAIPLLHALVSRDEVRAELLGQVEAQDMAFAAEVRPILATPPPRQLVTMFAALEAYLEATPDRVGIGEMLRPGEIWHVDPTTPVGACLGWGIKEAAQRELLANAMSSGLHVLILAADWVRPASLDLDARCLPLPDCRLIYGVPHASRLMEKHGAEVVELMAKFPRQIWHRCHDDAARRLVKSLAPPMTHDQSRLGDMAWGRRLQVEGGRLLDVFIRDTSDHAAYRAFVARHPIATTGGTMSFADERQHGR